MQPSSPISPLTQNLPESKCSGDTARLLAIMEKLRDPLTGCPWDVRQSFESIAPYTIEEAYEVADAIHRADMAALCDELGDLLLQVVFHARIAEENGSFAFDDVVTAICDKLIRRHPHVFGNGDPSPGWEEIKAAERAVAAENAGAPGSGALDGVARALPALIRAEKIQKRAARTGFDWPDLAGVTAKIEEELAEVLTANDADEREDEVGDLLFATVNLARHLKVDPEVALMRATAKFEQRFRDMEVCAHADGNDFTGLSLDAKEALWKRAKLRERDSA